MRKLHLKTVDDMVWRRVYHDDTGAYVIFSDDQGNEDKLYVRELSKIKKGNVFEVPQGHPRSSISHRDYTKYPSNQEIRSWDAKRLKEYSDELNERHQDLHFKSRTIEDALRNTPNLPRDQYVEIRRQLEATKREMAEIRSMTQLIASMGREAEWKAAKPPSIKPKVFMLRATIGHYGGTFVDVPAEEYEAFRSKFDKRAFPRGENIRNRTYGGFAYKSVFFDNGTKSSKRLEELRSKKLIALKYT